MRFERRLVGTHTPQHNLFKTKQNVGFWPPVSQNRPVQLDPARYSGRSAYRSRLDRAVPSDGHTGAGMSLARQRQCTRSGVRNRSVVAAAPFC